MYSTCTYIYRYLPSAIDTSCLCILDCIIAGWLNSFWQASFILGDRFRQHRSREQMDSVFADPFHSSAAGTHRWERIHMHMQNHDPGLYFMSSHQIERGNIHWTYYGRRTWGRQCQRLSTRWAGVKVRFKVIKKRSLMGAVKGFIDALSCMWFSTNISSLINNPMCW